jgi:hypothetical protein
MEEGQGIGPLRQLLKQDFWFVQKPLCEKSIKLIFNQIYVVLSPKLKLVDDQN